MTFPATQPHPASVTKRVRRAPTATEDITTRNATAALAPSPTPALNHRFKAIAIQQPDTTGTTVSSIRRGGASGHWGMADCPPTEAEMLNNTRFNPYHGMTIGDINLGSMFFHGGGSGYTEDRTPDVNAPQNECFYRGPGGTLDSGWTGGSPNYYDSQTSPWSHTFADPGGPLSIGWLSPTGGWDSAGARGLMGSAGYGISNLWGGMTGMFSGMYDWLFGGPAGSGQAGETQ